MRKNIFAVVISTALLIVLTAAGVQAQIASGGSYTLDQAVIAGGGGTSGGGTYSVSGTAGQSAAGDFMYGGPYVARSGFWNNLLAPTAAAAKIEGRVVDLAGKGLGGVTVSLTGASLTSPRIVKSNSFGNFAFENVEVGQVYIVSVTSRRYGFGQNSVAVSLTESVSDILFQSNWEN